MTPVWRQRRGRVAARRWTEPKLSHEEAHMLASATVHHYRNSDGDGVLRSLEARRRVVVAVAREGHGVVSSALLEDPGIRIRSSMPRSS